MQGHQSIMNDCMLFKKGGTTLSCDQLQLNQSLTVKSLAAAEKEGTEPPVITSECPDSEKNVCSKDVSMLNRILIADLKPNKIHEDRILWVKTVTAATKRPAVNLIVQDDAEDTIMLELHNEMESDASLAQV